MTAILIIVAAIILLLIGYVGYGSWLAKQWGDSRTPEAEAYFINDARWAQVYCWAWDKDNPYINYTGGQWPGEKIDKIGTTAFSGL